MQKLTVSLLSGSYPVLIGKGAVDDSWNVLRSACPSGKAAVVSDENVWRLHGARLKSVLTEAGLLFGSIILPPGESVKTLASVERIYSELYRFGLMRNDPVFAFGGGVIGDTAGFAAATYMRGVPLVQIPTTLLAQVDSCVGGKVSVNLGFGKNLAGSFYQPRFVISDSSFLTTLPEREWLSGMAEVVKYAALGESELMKLLEAGVIPRSGIDRAVFLCCRRKAEYVGADECDRGVRKLLNFGHTFGHAIEALHGFKSYTHGEAVAAGMTLAGRTGSLLGLSTSDTEQAVSSMLAAQGLSTRLSDTIEELLPFMSADKKNSDGVISLVLLRKIGQPFIHDIEPQALSDLFKENKW